MTRLGIVNPSNAELAIAIRDAGALLRVTRSHVNDGVLCVRLGSSNHGERFALVDTESAGLFTADEDRYGSIGYAVGVGSDGDDVGTPAGDVAMRCQRWLSNDDTRARGER